MNRPDSVTTLRLKIRRIESRLAEAMARDREAVRLGLDRLRRAGDPALIDGAVDRLEARLAASIAAKARRRQNLPALAFPEALPITARKEEIVAAIQKHPVVIVSGETGSGKSTQIPKFCLAAGRGLDGMIGHTQPRRIAAVAVAQRIAEELGEPLGHAVGYKIRFSDRTARDAYIKIMTDGILLAETQTDRRLSAYDTIIVDEAHERNLNIDFILGYLKRLVERRRDLKVVITSATIDTEKFSRAFGGAPVIDVTGRTFPVEVRYADPGTVAGDNGEVSHVELAVQAVAEIARERREGDVLVFMPTEQDIRDACEALEGRVGRHAVILPLFARLTAADQARVFKPAGRRKIIVATNVAETSITIPGIRYVVDTGLARISRYSPRTRTTALPVAPISRSSADQRQGRCGRVENGVCIRLYSEEDYLARPQYTAPEILRANLAEVILRMIALGLGDVADFPFIDRPEAKSIRDGFSLLTELGAIEEGGRRKGEGGRGKAEGEGRGEGGGEDEGVRLTETGRMMARMPLDPRLSRMLIAAHEEGCEADIAVIASALSIQDPRERPSEKSAEADRVHAAFNAPASDFLTLLTIWKRFHQARSEHPSLSALKRFCRDHFLSFRRMREWEDIHAQVTDIMAEFGWRRRRAGADAARLRPDPPRDPGGVSVPHRRQEGEEHLPGGPGPGGDDFPGLGPLRFRRQLDRGRRDGGDLAAVRPRGGHHRRGLARAGRREAVPVGVHGPALGHASGRGRRHRAGEPLRPGHRAGPDRGLRPDQPRRGGGHLHPPCPGAGGDRAALRLHAAQPGSDRPGPGLRGPPAAPGPLDR